MKALGLVSGGLDGLLAVRLIEEQGIEVIPVYFYIPFLRKDKPLTSILSPLGRGKGEGRNCKVIDISGDFIRILKRPKHGFGSNMNPCIDCRILMLAKAKELMNDLEASFVITGEVLGQRPMSQHKRSLLKIEKDSRLEGLLLRPLSAKLLPETIPEKNRWVDRNKLLDLNGRGRRQQLELAGRFNINGYAKAGGGCLLTESLFVNKLKDLIKYSEFNIDNIELLKIGRHFRVSDKAKLIVGRDEKENERLINLAGMNDYLFKTIDIAGPVGLGRGILNEDLVKLCAGIICYYSDMAGQRDAEIAYTKFAEQEEHILKVCPIDGRRLEELRI